MSTSAFSYRGEASSEQREQLTAAVRNVRVEDGATRHADTVALLPFAPQPLAAGDVWHAAKSCLLPLPASCPSLRCGVQLRARHICDLLLPPTTPAPAKPAALATRHLRGDCHPPATRVRFVAALRTCRCRTAHTQPKRWVSAALSTMTMRNGEFAMRKVGEGRLALDANKARSRITPVARAACRWSPADPPTTSR